MAVKEGYKQTEVGVIPEDWELVYLSEACLLSKKKHTPINSSENYKCIELEHVEQNTGRLLGYTESKKQLSQKNYFFLGSVLFGKLRPYLRKYYYADFDGVCSTEMWVLLSSLRTDSKYLYYLMQSEPIIEACNKSVGTKMPRAEWNIVNNTLIAIPPLPEQKAIASALSDIDGLINSLSKLIEKKKNIKQGAMQELLTGKKRLEGFSGEWDYVPLCQIAKVTIGLVTTMTTNYVQTGTLLVRNSDIMPNKIKENGLINLDNNFAEKNKSRKFKINDIVTVHTGDVGTSAVINGKMAGSIGFATLNTRLKNSEVNPYYLSTFFNSSIYKRQALEMVTGDGRNNLNLKDFEKSVVPLPPTIEEQIAIATILSDMDSEIEKLQSKLDKYKAIKQGMMQELLTGRIRLLEGA